MAHRTNDLFAFTAKKPGKVSSLESTGVIVTYDDGSEEGYELGRRFGSSQGLTVAHSIVTRLKVGDTVDVGDPIVYNEGFFEPDFFDKKKIVWKNSFNVKTVLWESTQTHEDSSAISKKVSSKLATNITKVKIVVVKFDQAVSEIVKVGDSVVADSTLCLIEDSFTANSKLFNEQSLQTLRSISSQAPRAHVKGTVERVEVYYHGDKEDLSESLLELVNKTDKDLRKRAASMGKSYHSGQVDGGFRVDGQSLEFDTVAIKFYITSLVGSGVGDSHLSLTS